MWPLVVICWAMLGCGHSGAERLGVPEVAGEPGAALDAASDAIAQGGGAPGLKQLAAARLSMGYLVSARAAAHRAIGYSPDDVGSHVLVARAEAQLGRPREAVAAYRRAAALAGPEAAELLTDEMSAAYLKSATYAISRRWVRLATQDLDAARALGANGRGLARAWVAVAEELALSGDAAGSAAALSRARSNGGSGAMLGYADGERRALEGDLDGAKRRWFEWAADREAVDGWLRVSRRLARVGRNADALDAAERAAELEPSSVEPALAVAAAALADDRPEEVLNAYLRLLRGVTERERLLGVLLAGVEHLHGNGQSTIARTLAQAVSDAFPGSFDAALLTVRLAEPGGDAATAVAPMTRWLQTTASSPVSVDRAVMAVRRYRGPRAAHALASALVDPQREDARATLRLVQLARLAGVEASLRPARLGRVRMAAVDTPELALALATEHVEGGEIDAAKALRELDLGPPGSELQRLMDAVLLTRASASRRHAADAVFSSIYGASRAKAASALRIAEHLLQTRQFRRARGWLVRATEATDPTLRAVANDRLVDVILFNPAVRDGRQDGAITRWFAEASDASIALRARDVRRTIGPSQSAGRLVRLKGQLNDVLAGLCRWEVEHHGGPAPHEILGAQALARGRSAEAAAWWRKALPRTLRAQEQRETFAGHLLMSGADDEALALLAAVPVTALVNQRLHPELSRANAVAGAEARALGHTRETFQDHLQHGGSGVARAVTYADAFTTRGDPATARALLSLALESGDPPSTALLALGRASLASGAVEAADAAFNDYINSRPVRRYQRIRKVAEVCVEFGPVSRAAAYYEMLLAEPQRTETRTYQKLATAYRDMGGESKRLLAASRAFLERPQNQRRAVTEVIGQLTDAGLVDEAAEIARDAVTTQRATSVLKAAFRNALVRRDSADVLSWGGSLLKRQRHAPKQVRETVRAAVDAGLAPIAAQLATGSLSAGPADAAVLLERGRAYLMMGDDARAQGDFLAALSGAASVRDLLTDLTHIHRRAGALGDLIQLQRRAIAVAPRRPELTLSLAETLMELGRDEEGLREVGSYLQRNPRGHLEAGAALARGGHASRSIDALVLGLADAGVAEASGALAECARQSASLGEPARFSPCASAFIATVPRNGDTLTALALSHEVAGLPEEALTWRELARRVAPNAEVLLGLHAAYLSRGAATQADEVAAELLALGGARDVAAFGRSRVSQGRRFDANLSVLNERYLGMGAPERLATLLRSSALDVHQRFATQLVLARAELAASPDRVTGPLARAIAAVDATPRIAKEGLAALVGMARQLTAVGDGGAAKRLLTRARERGWGSSVEIDAELVRTCLETGDKDCAWQVASSLVSADGRQHAALLARTLVEGGAVELAVRLSERALRRGQVDADLLWIAAWARSPLVARAPPAARATAAAMLALDDGEVSRAHALARPYLHVSRPRDQLIPMVVAAALEPDGAALERTLDAIVETTADRRWVLQSLWTWADSLGSAPIKVAVGRRLLALDTSDVAQRFATVQAAEDAGELKVAAELRVGLPGDGAPASLAGSPPGTSSGAVARRAALIDRATLGDAAALRTLATAAASWDVGLAVAVDHWRRGNSAAAGATMAELTARYPMNGQGLELAVDSAIVAGDIAGARKLVDGAIARGVASSWSTLGWVLDAAVNTPSQRAALRGWLDAWLQGADAPRPPNARAARWLRARRAAIAEDAAAAAAVYEAVLGRAPDDLAARNGLAWTLALDGRRTGDAIRLARSALRQAPLAWTGSSRVTDVRPIVLDTLAWAHHRHGDHREAWSLLQRALTIGVSDPAARAELLFHAGKVAAALGDEAGATRSYQRCQRHLRASAWALRCARAERALSVTPSAAANASP